MLDSVVVVVLKTLFKVFTLFPRHLFGSEYQIVSGKSEFNLVNAMKQLRIQILCSAINLESRPGLNVIHCVIIHSGKLRKREGLLFFKIGHLTIISLITLL